MIKKILLIIATLFLIGCGDLNNKTYSNSKTGIILDTCKCKQLCLGEIYDTGCLISQAVHPKNCIDFEGIVIARGNYYRGKDEYFTKSNKEDCLKALALKQNEPSLCSSFPGDFSSLCLSTVGKKNFETEICKDIKYEYKSDCYLYISKNKQDFNLNSCDELNHDDRIVCYSNKATVNNDSSICLKLETNIDINNCYSQIYKKFDPFFGNNHYVPIYYDWFVKEKFDGSAINESYCVFESLIGDDNDSCYISLAMYHKNLNECYNLPRDKLGANLIRKCLFYTALWNNFELKDCDKFGVDFKECRYGVVLSKRNPELCKTAYSSIEDKNDCIYKIATDYYWVSGKKDIILCGELGNYPIKEDCIRKIYDENDEQFIKKEICKLLSDSAQFSPFGTFGAKCYYNFALKNLDLDSCNQIGDLWDGMRSDCKERINHTTK